MSTRPDNSASAPGPRLVQDKGRLHHVLSAGAEKRAAQEKAQAETVPVTVAPVGGSPALYNRDCEEGGVVCKKDDAYEPSATPETPFTPLAGARGDLDPSDNVREYIRQVLDNPDRWEQNGLLMLRPKEFDQPRGAPFEEAYRKYEVDQAAAGMRGNAHTTVLRAKSQGPIGTLKNIEGEDETVYGVTVQASFVDGDGPSVGIGYTMRIYLQNAAGGTLGTLFGLSKRNVAAYAPEAADLYYYLFVDLSEEWSVRGVAAKAYPPASINKGPALWNDELHNAMEFAVYRSISLLYNQFTN